MKFQCRDDQATLPGAAHTTPLLLEPELPPAHPVPHDWCPTSPGDPSALLPFVDDLGPKPAAEAKPAAAPADHGLHLDLKNRQLVAGDPTRPNDGYFLASAKEQGARWSTAGGDFTGKVDKSGLDATEVLGAHDQLKEHIGADKSGTVGWVHDGKTEGELFGNYKSGTDYEAGVRRAWDLSNGTLTTGLHQQGTSSGTLDGAFAGYKSKDGATTIDGSAGVEKGQFAGALSGSTKLSPHDTLTGSLSHDPTGTVGKLGETHTWDGGSLAGNLEVAQRPNGTTTTLSGAYTDHGTSINGSFVHGPGRDALSLSANSTAIPNLTLSGNAGFEHTAAGNQGTLGLSESYRSDALAESVAINGGVGTRNFLSATESVDARLAKNLYGSAWAGQTIEQDKHASSQLGASLTYVPSSKAAVTLAGSADDHGHFQTRLEVDMLKKAIGGAGDLGDRRADSPLGVFLQYSNGTVQNGLDSRFGAPTISGHDGMISGGIRIKF